MLFYDIARQFLPAPKANFVRVVINGESWGIYANVEQMNKEFAKESFGSSKGARWRAPGQPGGSANWSYLGEDPASYKGSYTLKSNDDPKAWAKLINVMKVLNQTAPDKLAAALDPIFDVDGALKFLALDLSLINNDGFWIRASDYMIFLDDKDKVHVLPWDANETFAVPALRAKYLGYVREIADKHLDWAKASPAIEKYRTLIRADMKTDTRNISTYEEFEKSTTDDIESGGGFGGPSRVISLKNFYNERRAYLLSNTPAR